MHLLSGLAGENILQKEWQLRRMIRFLFGFCPNSFRLDSIATLSYVYGPFFWLFFCDDRVSYLI